MRRAALHLREVRPGRGQQREQRTALHAEAEQSRIEPRVTHVHDGTAAGVLAEQSADARTVRERGVEQAHLPQHVHADRLQQEARADGSEFRRLFEDLDALPIARQQDRGRLPGGAVADDCDVQHAAHAKVPLACVAGSTIVREVATAG
jgi:hypothetical protein